MKTKIIFTFFLLTTFFVRGQNSEKIKQKQYQKIISNTKIYLFGEGADEDPSNADKQALYNLTSQINISVQSNYNETSSFDNKGNFEENVKSVVKTYSGATLQQAQRIQIVTKEGFNVLRYIKRSDLDKIFEARTKKIKDIISYADKYLEETKISDALRNYYSALILVKSHPKKQNLKNTQGKILEVYLPNKIKDIIGDIQVIATNNEIKNSEQNVSIKFLYKGLPIQNISYTYETETGYNSPIESIDGKAMIDFAVTNIPRTSANVAIEYKFSDQKFDNEVDQVMKSPIKKPSFFKYAVKKINLNKKNYKNITIADENKKILAQKSADISIEKKLVAKKIPIDKCKKNLQSVLGFINKKNYKKIYPYCTNTGKKLVEKLLKYGNVKLLPIEKITTIQRDKRLQIRSIPMFFSFKNSKQKFTENVVFFFDENEKICNLSFGLSSKTFDEVIRKKTWTTNEKATLVNFMEQYKTAYALKRLDYIEDIFSDDALIIVGRVIKNTHTLDDRYRKNKIVKTNKLTKRQFIKHLARSFKSKEYINLKLEDIDFMKRGRDKGVFGIKVKQFYHSSNYSDVGYLFLLVDLRKPLQPIVHVRTWQAEKDEMGRVYGMGNF